DLGAGRRPVRRGDQRLWRCLLVVLGRRAPRPDTDRRIVVALRREETAIGSARVIKRPFNWAAAYFAAVATIATASAQTQLATTGDGGDQAQIDHGKMTYAEKC